MARRDSQGQHFAHSRKLPRASGAVPLCLGLLAVSVAALIWSLIPVWHPPSTSHQPDKRAPRVATIVRPVYPYSVLPGGAYDAAELRTKLASDEVAARHYQDFSQVHVKTVKASSDRWVYMSYRRGGAIYWTTKRLHLHAGETLLSDGIHYARARCGNRIAETPQQPVEKLPASPPSELMLDVPESWQVLLPAVSLESRDPIPSPPLPAPGQESQTPTSQTGIEPVAPGVRFAPPPVIGPAAPGSGPRTPSQSLPAPAGGQPPGELPVSGVTPPRRPVFPTLVGSAPGRGGSTPQSSNGPPGSGTTPPAGSPPPGAPQPGQPGPGPGVPPPTVIPGGPSPGGPGPGPPGPPSIPVAVVPEPGSLVLLATALAGMLAVRRWARRTKRRAGL